MMSPAHVAVELEDLVALRDLLDAGTDPNEIWQRMTLLDHAIDLETQASAQPGERLRADLTAYLLARGADPLRSLPGQPTTEHQAFNSRHWLALDLFASWKARHGRSSVGFSSCAPVIALRPASDWP